MQHDHTSQSHRLGNEDSKGHLEKKIFSNKDWEHDQSWKSVIDHSGVSLKKYNNPGSVLWK